MSESRSSAAGADSANWAETGEPDPHSDRLNKFSLSHQIAERLRNDIVQGRIPAGTPMLQYELCERFGTSRMPVRDALQQLTHEGILQRQGQQRVVVALGAEELEEALALTAILHGWAAGRAAQHATDAEIEDLASLCQTAIDTEDPYDFAQLGMQFHRQINRLAHSQRLIRTLIAIQQTVPRAIPFTIPEEMGPGKERFKGILAAIQSRDIRQAEELTRSDLTIGVELLLRTWGTATSQK